MRNYLRGLMAIAKKDFRGFFAGPLFYVLSGLAFAILSWNFFYGTAQFIETAQGGAMAGFGGGGGYNIRELLFINHYVMYFWILFFVIGAMAIKFLAEEKKNNTFDLLWTAPITPMQIVSGKFVAGTAMVLILTMISFIYPLMTWIFSSLEWGAMFASFVGLFLIAMVFVSVGMFVSSLTSSAVLTVVGSIIIFFALLLLGWMEKAFGGVWWAQEVFRHISIASHMETFLKGSLKLSSIVFLVTFSLFWLFLSEGSLKFSAVSLSEKKLKFPSKVLLGTAFLCVIVPALYGWILRYWPNWFWAPVGFAVLALAAVAALESHYLRAFMASKTAAKDLNVGTSLVLTLLLLSVVNYIAAKNDVLWDMTEGKVNTLSGQTTNILESLQEPAKIVSLYQDDQALQQVEAQLTPLVDMYRDASPNIRYERANLHQQPQLIQTYNLSSRDSFALFVEYQGRHERITGIDENAITTAIAKAVDTTTRKFYRVVGHGELEPEQSRQGIGLFTEELERLRYEIVPLDLTTVEAVPTDGAFVAIWGPQSEFSENEIQLLRDYVREGGRIFLAMDPLERHGLAQLTKSFGITFDNTVIYSENVRPTPTIAVGLPKAGGHELAASLPTQVPTLFYNASPLTEEAQPDNPFQFTALVTTSMPVRSLTSLDESAQIAGEGEMTLVALAERRMASDSTEDAGKIEDLSGIVVVGDSNFLTDQFLLQGANETLASNLVYYMSRNQQVMGVQPRRAVATVLAPKVTWYRPVFFLMIGVLPIVFLGGGVTVWLRRKAA